ncbi:glycosyltransferase [Gymnodinialimonas sp.]
MTSDAGSVGQAEDGGAASDPPDNLLTSQADRNAWREWLAHACSEDGGGETLEDILARHPRASALRDGFSLGAYLTHNSDVAGAVDRPQEALFHYLEFGIAEGRNGTPTRWSPDFVAETLGHRLPSHLTAPQAATALTALGVPASHLMLGERDLWLLLGLHGPTLEHIFHHETYLAALDAAGMELPAPDRVSCIHHFAATGLDAGIPAHPDHQLDEAFYAASLAELSLEGPATPRHWASIGLRANAHANPKAAARARFNVHLPTEVSAGSTGHLARMLLHPMPLVESLDLSHTALRSFAIDLARQCRRRGDIGTAEALLAHVVSVTPDDPRASVDLAELIHGTRQITREIALRSVAPPDFDGGENRVTLARLHYDQGNLDAALTCASTLPDAARGDVAITRKARAVARMIIDDLSEDLETHLAHRLVVEVQDLLTRALAIYAPTPDRLDRSGQIARVAILANDDLYQCKLYRADQRADQLRAQGLQVTVFLHSTDVAALHAQLAQFDAVIFQRTPALPDTADVMMDAAKQGLATFFDVDDLIFDPRHFPPPLETYAGQIGNDTRDAIACGVPFFAAAARLCGTGIASTDPIRDALAPLTITGTAFTHRNALGAAHAVAMAAAKKPKNDKLVLFYGSGTKAHKAEFSNVLEPALAEVLQARPGRVEIRLMGEFPPLRHLSPDDVTLMPPIWDFEAYMDALSQADIALSVLAPSPAADAKSEIKWMEPAMFAIPAVVSPSPVMADVIDNGATGIIADDAEAFTSALLHLIDEDPLRLSMGQAARAQVLRDYAMPAMGAALVENMQATRSAPKPKLLVVNVFFPPQALGGATRVVADNVTHLLDRHGDGFEVDILTTLNGGKTAHKVQAVSHSGARIWAITRDKNVPERAMRDPVMDARIEALLDRIQPDIVHAHCLQRLGAGVIDACRRRGIPYVLTLHDGWWTSPHQFITGPDGAPSLYDFTASPLAEREQIARRCITDAAAALAVSEPFAQLHRDAGLSNVTALSNGVSTLPERNRTDPPEGRVRLGLIGGASRHKGYDILRAALTAQAFENIDLIVSDHSLPPGAEVHEVWNTTPVLRIPRQPQAQVGTLYGRFDVLMAPSVWPESFGLVTREAMALGLWVVASDRGAIGADIVEGENGHIVPVDDHRALTRVLAQIDANPARYTQPPPHRAELRTAAEQGDALVALYKDILAGRPKR